MKTRLPRSVLLALGLTASCDRCSRHHVGPCLNIAPEALPDPEPEPEPERPIHIGPCLKIAPPDPEPPPEPQPADTGVHPCLEFAPDYNEGGGNPTPEPEGEQGALPRDSARQKVLAQGILPDDVAALLRKKRRG